MANEDVMAVRVCRDTVNIMLFNVQRDDVGKITKINFLNNRDSNLQDAIADMRMLLFTYPISACLIDTMVYGIDIFRKLKLEKDFTIPIYETNRCTATILSNSIMCLRDFLETDFVEVKHSGLEKDNLLKVLSNCTITSNGLVKPNNDDYLTFDIAFMVNTILTYKENTIQGTRDNKIKNNLKEVIDILFEELNELDRNDTSKLENLLKLIDKVNYVKGQI